MSTADGKRGGHVNRLGREKSPYLLQHATNPVDWYAWGPEAFEKARAEDKPVFLSIGYATCHWCHVMAHESFEDVEVARILKEHFVSIKVDREERPDVDKVYMSACQAMTRGGGWPLTIFMTPDGKPFFAGTYFPKRARGGAPGFIEILERIGALWEKERERLVSAGEEIARLLEPREEAPSGTPALDERVLAKGVAQLAEGFDRTWGGFSQAPKFPIPHNLAFLVRRAVRSGDDAAGIMARKTLEAMRDGGMFDQVGFGFHRYSVDERWLVPHFEKMLYDQALLAMAYTDAAQAFGSERYAEVAREIFRYVLRDMTSPEGGFCSGEDADSEGEEGLFYLWTPEEIVEPLGRDTGELFCRFYGIVPGGNFEHGKSIPHVQEAAESFAKREGMTVSALKQVLEEARARLFEIREKREHPLKDDKVLTSWNGLMIAALARGYQVLGDPDYARAASKAVDFVQEKLVKDSRFLLRRYRQGDAAYPGYLDDYAFLVWGLIELYESTFAVDVLEMAVALQESMLDQYWDELSGAFYFTGKANEPLIVRSKDAYDGALPSGNSVATLNLLRLGRMIGRPDWEEKADRVAGAFAASIAAYPMAYTHFLASVEFMIGPTREIVVAGDAEAEETREMVRIVHGLYLPNKVLLLRSGGAEGERIARLAPHVAEMSAPDGKTAAYVCERYACQQPVTDVARLREVLTPSP